MMSLEDYRDFADRWGSDCPFEPKATDCGRINGRLVALDYSIPVYDSEEERAEQLRAVLADWDQ